MNRNKIIPGIICIVMTICITIASIYFKSPSILWWYIAPALLTVDLI